MPEVLIKGLCSIYNMVSPHGFTTVSDLLLLPGNNHNLHRKQQISLNKVVQNS